MTEKSFTFFEIHLHDGLSFSATNTAPAIGGSSAGESDDDATESQPDERDSGSSDTKRCAPFCGGSRSLQIGGLVALALLVALAAAAKHLRGGGDALSELDDIDE
ncbi:hypothetical protein [Halobellus captivus]|uniref:hypothetical protein n=1 Tax=Halobellus captivus TaxID=2592614 RepID=UPI00119DB9E8|nr:hypothetical protein [Halobellus captivus]